jgi:hypothetical protein
MAVSDGNIPAGQRHYRLTGASPEKDLNASNMHSLRTFVVAYPCVAPSASIGGGGAPKVDIAFHGVLVDRGEFLCREVQVVEGGDTLLQLGDTARPDED